MGILNPEPQPRQLESDPHLSPPPRGAITTEPAALAAEVAEQVARYRCAAAQGPTPVRALLPGILHKLLLRRLAYQAAEAALRKRDEMAA